MLGNADRMRKRGVAWYKSEGDDFAVPNVSELMLGRRSGSARSYQVRFEDEEDHRLRCRRSMTR